ncbi:MAG: imidazole glycerol phosphate synthase subunit HisH [Chitinophagales bacterium]
MLVVIDYGVSNIGSLLNMLEKIGVKATVAKSAEMLEQSTKIILPGIGAFDAGMRRLNELNLVDVLNQKVLKEKVPVLGICLGMQLMAKKSEEGKLSGLSWFDGEVVRFNFLDSNPKLKIPHMGWNYIDLKKSSRLFGDDAEAKKFYFVHSYYFKTNNSEDILATTNYGYDFVSAIESGNIAGVQFHPEKSHRFGLRLLTNFIEHF